MSRTGLILLLPLWALCRLSAQEPDGLAAAIHPGPGITPPRPLQKPEPGYSRVALANHIQGTVVLQMGITEKGRTEAVMVISPLGFGLDECAIDAVRKWTFAPATKNGKPVKTLAEVAVHFRLPGTAFDQEADRQRADFNVALQALEQTGPSSLTTERAVQSMQDLSSRGFPPAMFVVALWEAKGNFVAQDPAGSLALIQAAAAHNYGPALFEIATRQIEGRDLPKDVASGLATMRRASDLGSDAAQYLLGQRYEKGDEVPRDPLLAEEYFRRCAARGVGLCQYRLGRLLLAPPDRPERDRVQAVAWLQLAAEQGVPVAQDLAAREASGLTPEQANWVARLKAQLHRP